MTPYHKTVLTNGSSTLTGCLALEAWAESLLLTVSLNAVPKPLLSKRSRLAMISPMSASGKPTNPLIFNCQNRNDVWESHKLSGITSTISFIFKAFVFLRVVRQADGCIFCTITSAPRNFVLYAAIAVLFATKLCPPPPSADSMPLKAPAFTRFNSTPCRVHTCLIVALTRQYQFLRTCFFYRDETN